MATTPDMPIEEQAEEYISGLVSIELCAAIARIHGEQVNRKIRDCCSAVIGRCRDSRNKRVFEGLQRQMFPSGALAMMRRRLDECCLEADDDD